MSFTAEKFDSLILCKSEFQQKCQQWGLRAPKNMVVENIEIAILESQSWGFPIVLKLDSGYGGSGVFICHNELDLRTHFLKLRSVSLFYKVKNWAKNIFFVSVLSTGSKVSIQEFIDGQVGQSPFCARKGKVFAINSMLKLETHPGKTGPSSVSGGYENQDIDFYVSKVAKNLNYSGFGSLEYIVQKDTGQIYIIEMNPRPTPTCHIGNSFVTNDLCDMLYRGLNSLPLETRKFRPFTLALYPNEKKRDPHSKYLATSFTYHDIPLDDPELIKALT
jgi:carbamoyl-phosphate synthase large subunit